MNRVAEWWFGTDMVDLLRSANVELARQGGEDGMGARWIETFGPAIDHLQLALDRQKLSSEVHILLDKIR